MLSCGTAASVFGVFHANGAINTHEFLCTVVYLPFHKKFYKGIVRRF